MQQRVALVRAFALGSPILPMDEPFAALDEITRDAMRYMLLDLWQNKGITVIFVTHSIAEAVILSDRVAVMSTRPGRISAIEEIHRLGRVIRRWRTASSSRHIRGAIRKALRSGWDGATCSARDALKTLALGAVDAFETHSAPRARGPLALLRGVGRSLLTRMAARPPALCCSIRRVAMVDRNSPGLDRGTRLSSTQIYRELVDHPGFFYKHAVVTLKEALLGFTVGGALRSWPWC